MPNNPLIGAHVSVAGGVDKAAQRAKEQGCEVMQIFVQNPQKYQVPETTDEEVEKFQTSLKKHHIAEVYAHVPYLINLASPDNRIRYGSINLIKKNLERASKLGCKYVMTHVGSYGEGSDVDGQIRVIKSLNKALEGYQGKSQLLLELSAGSGHIIGSKFEEIHKILTGLKPHKIGVCLDTAHIFASGYDLRGRKNINRTLTKFDKIIGLDKLKLIHINNSAVKFKSHKDRHADLGDGEIGLDNFKLMINHAEFKRHSWILETPGDEGRRRAEIKVLRKFRG